MTQPNALFLADVLERSAQSHTQANAAAEMRRLHALIAACEPYLKEGETPAERIERDHRDSLALMTLLAREKTKNKALLEALKVIVENGGIGPEDMFDDARAAIAKAEGNT